MYEFAVTPAITQIRRRGVEISEVTAGSLGAELELEPGDRVMRVNGRPVRDYLDFRFQAGGETDLSFLYGNYTTLTSITEDEMGRVIEQRLSPQYVSVHATDLKVRAYLLGVDQQRADITQKMQRMLEAGIEIHAQVVLCPEINDGKILQRTIYDLAKLHPGVRSVAIVPLGLTRYLNDQRLTAVTPEFCRRTINEVSIIQADLRARLGTTFAFLGDEIYLRAGRPVPSRKHYGDYPQIEDGIGMVRSFANEFETLMRRLGRKRLQNPERVFGTIMTGSVFAPVLRHQVDRMNRRFGTRLEVVAVENEYFGGDVCVAGLLTGGDFIAASDRVRGEFAIIPRVALKSDEPLMLDGMRFEELQKQFNVPLYAFDFSSLAVALESGFVDAERSGLDSGLVRPIRGHHTATPSSL